MKCLVCGKEFQGTVCPICEFPIVEIPGDYEAGLRTLQPVIRSHREAFAEKIHIGVMIFEYEIDNGTIRETGSRKKFFGKVAEMMHRKKWLDTVFENPLSRKSMDIHMVICVDGRKDDNRTVSIPTPKTEGKISLGIVCEDTFCFYLIVKDEKGNEVTSRKMEIVR